MDLPRCASEEEEERQGGATHDTDTQTVAGAILASLSPDLIDKLFVEVAKANGGWGLLKLASTCGMLWKLRTSGMAWSMVGDLDACLNDAAAHGNTGVVLTLLDARADPAARVQYRCGTSAGLPEARRAHCSLLSVTESLQQQTRKEIPLHQVRALLRSKADMSQLAPSAPSVPQFGEGLALHRAAQSGNASCVEVLLNAHPAGVQSSDHLRRLPNPDPGQRLNYN